MNTSPPTQARPAHPSFREAFLYWLTLGFISFGGPAGQIAIMHQELVEKRRWISEHRFLHALNYCMLLPGPEAQQLAIYIGWLLHRTWGGIVAGVLFVLPSLFILAALTYVYLAFGDLTFVQGVFNGIKPAVVAIVVFAAWRIGSRALKNNVLWALAAASFVAIFVFGVPFPYIVLVAGILGYIGGRVMPDKFRAGGGHGASDKDYGPALIDDDTPPMAHTRFRWSYLVTLLIAALALWVGAMAMLEDPVLRDMGEFFTKAALLTFGGAYAVLPYVYQGGVETYGWLTGTQMIDGLALGETTPGPLIMVVSFVGFVGAWTKEIFGADALALAGMAGATVATFFTFLPSFVFILAGAPLVESTHGDLKFTAPLTGITAAVVGVVLNLALFFGWHVIFPRATEAAPFAGGFEWFYALISLAAFIALWKYKQDIMKVIAACGAIGLVFTYLR
ncbi:MULTISPECIES: chromate efflux transporter [Thauera]|uniref:Chromate transport protein ChrA n=2 Tax=Betaproteobacteria TaxID=28216 RepID=A0A1H5YLA4_9RHOO|nr:MULTISPECIES: chromate efflux transporter [Thauera]APR03075.1 chromate transport protein ChrA [Thauera chlorobenzoica]ENO82001.1 chromate ion transporter [Thauera sp. 27]SEG24432.1 chromate transporter [Thauera chlorobenzoica]HRK10933.1 chromate efflux transporter [Thauera sp.]